MVLPDENKWIFDMHANLMDRLQITIKPLEEYLALFNELKPILELMP